MKAKLLEVVLRMAMMFLSADMIKQAIDSLLDVIEDAVAKSETTMDDAIVVPMCNAVRAALDVPDNDE